MKDILILVYDHAAIGKTLTTKESVDQRYEILEEIKKWPVSQDLLTESDIAVLTPELNKKKPVYKYSNPYEGINSGAVTLILVRKAFSKTLYLRRVCVHINAFMYEFDAHMLSNPNNIIVRMLDVLYIYTSIKDRYWVNDTKEISKRKIVFGDMSLDMTSTVVEEFMAPINLVFQNEEQLENFKKEDVLKDLKTIIRKETGCRFKFETLIGDTDKMVASHKDTRATILVFIPTGETKTELVNIKSVLIYDTKHIQRHIYEVGVPVKSYKDNKINALFNIIKLLTTLYCISTVVGEIDKKSQEVKKWKNSQI